MDNEFIIGNTYNIEWHIQLTEEGGPEESEKFQKWIVGTTKVSGVYKIVDSFNMVTAHGHNIFCDEIIAIPKDAIFKELTDIQKDYFLRDQNQLHVFDEDKSILV